MKKVIVVGAILLLLGSSIPVLASSRERLIHSTANGHMLYVGGTGPGNFSHIQDAINASINGDTVFVYDDSSPYFEHLIVNKSITLKGEKRETTIIDGNHSGCVIVLQANNTELSGFTVQHCGNTTWDFGIGSFRWGPFQSLKITGNIVKDNNLGVNLSYWSHVLIEKNTFIGNLVGVVVEESQQIAISRNLMENNEHAIVFIDLSYAIFSYNTIQNSTDGIGGGGVYLCAFYHNIIHNNTNGLELVAAFLTTITRNEFSNNFIGLYFLFGYTVRVNFNNFISNEIDANFTHSIIKFISPLLFVRMAVYHHNYWDTDHWPVPKRIVGEIWRFPEGYYYPPAYRWVKFDFFPAPFRHFIKNFNIG